MAIGIGDFEVGSVVGQLHGEAISLSELDEGLACVLVLRSQR